MSDTKRSVKWMIEQTCPMRSAEEWSNPLLSKAQIYGRQIQYPADTFGLHDGICVTTIGGVGSLPREGFDVFQTFAPLGGEGLQSMCGVCPAHAAESAVAGCAGSFHLRPYSSELDEELRSIALELGLTNDLEREFLATQLLWFGLWAESPLSQRAMETLQPLLSEYAARQEKTPRGRNYLGDFVSALEFALRNGLNLHVQLLPPGHVDFGWHSTFAHCPRCKAGAPVHPWEDTPSQTVDCGMCGLAFDPSQTASCQTMDLSEFSEPPLPETLGDEHYRTFATGYLIERGLAESEAHKRLDRYFESERESEENRRRILQKHYWERSVLMKGLGKLREEMGEEEIHSASFWLSVAEVEELLKRCQHWGVEFRSVSHQSETDEEDYICARAKDFGSIEAAFESLRAQGCAERFHVGQAKVPDHLLETI